MPEAPRIGHALCHCSRFGVWGRDDAMQHLAGPLFNIAVPCEVGRLHPAGDLKLTSHRSTSVGNRVRDEPIPPGLAGTTSTGGERDGGKAHTISDEFPRCSPSCANTSCD
jgi:hypothetical protein